jgi:hypothetical protein
LANSEEDEEHRERLNKLSEKRNEGVRRAVLDESGDVAEVGGEDLRAGVVSGAGE